MQCPQYILNIEIIVILAGFHHGSKFSKIIEAGEKNKRILFYYIFLCITRSPKCVIHYSSLLLWICVAKFSSTENYICKMKSIWCSKWPEKLFHQIFIMSQAVIVFVLASEPLLSFLKIFFQVKTCIENQF